MVQIRDLTSGADDASVSVVAYQRLRADIVFGRVEPGCKLGLEDLRETYGVSISTLRELLSRLCSESLVAAEGQKGFRVAPVSAADFRDIAALRLILEGHALEHSFAAGDLEWEGRVVAAHHKLSVLERQLLAGQRAKADLWKRYDWEFHRALIGACGSTALLETHAAIYDRYLRYQMVAVIFRGEVAAEEHRGLLQCALERDSTGARRILTAHINGCVEHALRTGVLDRFLDRRRGGLPPATSRETTGAAAYRLIRTDILDGTLDPGQKLRLESLRSSYPAGIGTLREILSRLAAERLVVAEGQRGFEVAPLSTSGQGDLAALRRLLECHALEESIAAGGEEWVAQLIAAHDVLARCKGETRAPGMMQWRRQDRQFHQALVAACRSSVLTSVHAAVLDQHLRYEEAPLDVHISRIGDEHRALLEHAVQRNAAAACEVLAAHIQ
jgi:DNA-binding GntR family transcriptional regulator